jgi:hypothetical protein
MSQNRTISDTDPAIPHKPEVRQILKPRRENNARGQTRGDPPDELDHDALGDDVAGENPGNLVDTGGEAALHIGQTHIEIEVSRTSSVAPNKTAIAINHL